LLWRYNAHYFDDLAADDADARRAWQRQLVRRWLDEQSAGRGPGWDAYPTSLRIVNWAKWLWSGGAGAALGTDVHQSLAVQSRWLERRLEWHLLGNHLWANAKALVFAGVYFTGPEADRWRALGLRIAGREFTEQVLGDGGHFERSPMYHASFLEDLLDLVQLDGLAPGLLPPPQVADWRNGAARMLSWLAAMSHPDGGPGFFNDTAIGVAPTLAALQAQAARFGIHAEPRERDGGARLLPDSGFARLDVGCASLLADVGSVGPSYQPGHAHAGTLSFELSLDDRRLVVNSGISTYAREPERELQRGTGAHSTLQVADADSSEVWAAFRVGRRARVREVRCGPWDCGAALSAEHDGYRFLPGSPVHARRWWLRPDGLRVDDRLAPDGQGGVVRFHLHPGWSLQCDGAASGRIVASSGRTVRWRVEGAQARRARGTWHRGFNEGEPNDVLEVHLPPGSGGAVGTEFEWEA
jgi:uncharacterized heparinase superfamily protein